MNYKTTKIIKKTVTALALSLVLVIPAISSYAANETSSVNTVTTNKNTWVTSMQNYKVTNLQETSVILYTGNGDDSAINYVKVGVKRDGEWQRVIGTASGIAMAKTNVKTTYSLNKEVDPGEEMRIRLKLKTASASTDTVTNAWWWN